MDKKFFENMDNRFKSIENELTYKFDSKFWEQAENELNNAELDNAFVKAAEQTSTAPQFDFNDIDDAFLDDAFIEAAKNTQYDYNPSYWKDYTQVENTLYYNDAFVTATALSQVVYDPNYWKDADLALQKEGLHYEYKPEYWAEAEKLLIQDARKVFFLRWGVAAGILLLLSFLTFNINNNNIENQQLSKHQSKNNKVETVSQSTHKNNLTVVKNKENQMQNNLDVHHSNVNSNHLSDEQNTNHFSYKSNQTSLPANSANHNLHLNNKTTDETTKNDVVNNNLLQEYNNKKEPSNINAPDNQISTIVNKTKSTIVNEEDKTFTMDEEIEDVNKDMALIKLNNKIVNHIYTPKKEIKIEQNKIDLTVLNTKPSHLLGVEVAKGIGNNFNNNNLSFRNSMYLSYTLIPFTPKVKNLSYGLDVGIYHQNLNEYEYETNYKVYYVEGNVDNYWYKMVYKDLVYFSSRANLYYTITNKHQLKLGVGVDKLITSRIDMQYKINKDFSPQASTNQWGLNNAINDLDFSINLAYQLDISNNFAFIINAKHGILDKTNDEYLNRTKNDIDKSLLLGIKYTFFRSNK